MEHERTLRFTPVDHPDARVRRIGFDLTDPYVEHCRSAVVGPSSTLLLRRLPTLWIARVPAEIDAGELSLSLGLDVYRQVPPLTQRQPARLPEWTRAAEERLLGEHLTQIDDSSRHRSNVVSMTARLDRLQHRAAPGLHGPTPHGPGIA